jgi:uncharacterized protein (TIGR02757 family)
MKLHDLKEFLDEKSDFYNNPGFIETDPICIPHRFEKKEDIEISGFLTATIAWGNRKSIIRNATRMMALMDNAPYDFVMNHKPHHLERFEGFVHRTFNHTDLEYFVKALQYLYKYQGGPEKIFSGNISEKSVLPAISAFRQHFFSLPYPPGTAKHVSDPRKGSVAKRINMFLRWMVRQDNRGVDFGLWHSVPSSVLSCPLDVHSGNVARKLGLINRKQNDLKALAELDTCLRQMDPDDPVKYDFALFGLGVFEKF